MKKDYRSKIHALFEEARKERKIESTLDIHIMQICEREEGKFIKENSQDALNKVLDFFHKRKKIIELPLAKKKFTLFSSGKIKEEVLL